MLPHLLPHSVDGLFVNYIDYGRSRFFARPSAQPRFNGDFNFLPKHLALEEIVDHCNGLLLQRCYKTLCVVNPATRRWDDIPLEYGKSDEYLVFDPITSPHYEVVSIPHLPKKETLRKSGPYDSTKFFSLSDDESSLVEDTEDEFEDGSVESSPEQSKKESDFPTSLASPPIERRGKQEDAEDLTEWPPSLWTLNVFSSRTRQWQIRSFIREGEAAGTLTNVRQDPWEPICKWWGGPRRRYSAYWQGSLYVHCRGAFVVRYTS
jgi:hypothetical protein